VLIPRGRDRLGLLVRMRGTGMVLSRRVVEHYDLPNTYIDAEEYAPLTTYPEHGPDLDGPWREGPTWIASDRWHARLVGRPLAAFLHVEAASGVVLFLAALGALVWANSGWSETYHALWALEIEMRVGTFELTHDLRYWTNDALMVLFFLVVGLEIKHELVNGELRDPRAAAVPIAAAPGGMAVPAMIYAKLKSRGGGRARGGGPPGPPPRPAPPRRAHPHDPALEPGERAPRGVRLRVRPGHLGRTRRRAPAVGFRRRPGGLGGLLRSWRFFSRAHAYPQSRMAPRAPGQVTLAQHRPAARRPRTRDHRTPVRRTT
jgi:hypothetical protein